MESSNNQDKSGQGLVQGGKEKKKREKILWKIININNFYCFIN